MSKKILSLLTALMVIIVSIAVSATMAMAATALKIVKQPASVSALNGKAAKVSVSASGDSLKYTWYYKNSGTTKYTKDTKNTSKTYSATMSKTVNGRTVYCVVKDKYGKTVTSKTATLKMGKAAKITKQPAAVSALNGKAAKVTLTATGDGLKYTWYYKNSGASKYTKDTKNTGNSYSVTMSKTVNGRTVYCVVKDKYGTSVKSKAVTVKMGKAAKITKQPANVTVLSGKSAKVILTATGDGLKYTWYYKNSGASKYTKDTKNTGNSYSVTMSKTVNGRTVYCVVKDKYGTSVKSKAVTLKMGTAAKITKQPVNVAVISGKTAKVTLTATGDGLKYTWYYKNSGASKYTKDTKNTGNSYSVTMSKTVNGRTVYCVVKDKYGTSVKSKAVTVKMGAGAKITTQPVSVKVDCAKTAKVTLKATGDSLKYTWYTKGPKATKFTKDTKYTGTSYSLKMIGDKNNKTSVYCIVKDKYGTSVQSKTVTLTCADIFKTSKVTKAATCTKTGTKVYTCSNCTNTKTETIAALGHKMGEWKVYTEATVTAQGQERSSCSRCTYYKDRTTEKLPVVYNITMKTDSGKSKVGVAANGKYTLPDPKKIGYNFAGWKTEAGKDFASTGVNKSNITVVATWELDGTDTFAELVERTDAGVSDILITSNITVTDTLYIYDKTNIYSNGNYTLKRDPSFAGDIFVVGQNRKGKTSVVLGKDAVLNLGGGAGVLTIDGNKDKLKTTVVGSALFIADSAVLNIYDNASVINHKKLSNKRTFDYNEAYSEYTMKRIGGAAIINLSGTVNMYGGLIDNNEVVTEYTVIPNAETGKDESFDYNGCGGAVFCYGDFHMYGGVISNNVGLRGGALYSGKFIYLDSGEFANNTAYSYGGAVSSSSGSDADTFIGTTLGDKKMIFRNNSAKYSGGAVYSNTSSPIVIYGNTEFIGNHSDSSGGAIHTAGALDINDSRFEGNTCAVNGGAIYNQYAKAEFERFRFTVKNSEFIDNQGVLGGAVILSAASTATDANGHGTLASFENCQFTGNKAVKSETSAGNGGAIYITRKSDATITNCSFTENSATNDGGAVAAFSGSNAQFTDVSFTGNQANNGGALNIASESEVKIKNGTFTENKALFNEKGSGALGGAVYVAAAKLSFNNVDMYRNHADKNGGAVLQNNIDLNIDSSCEFIGNSAGEHGGAFYLTYKTLSDGTKDGSLLNATKTLFKENTAQAGGAISIRSACEANLNEVELINNSATGVGKDAMGGGAVYVGYGKLNLTNTTATANTSTDFGGAVSSSGSEIEITNGNFSSNTALNGGAFYAANTNLKFTETKFINNEANYVQAGEYNNALGGGAINMSGGSLDFIKVTIDGNMSKYYGGAVLASKTAVTISESTIKNNTGATGTALFFKSACNTSITDTTVENNVSKGNGVIYTNGGTLEMTNVSATGNSASNGAVVYASGGSTVVNLNNSTWSGNAATNDGGTVYSANATINLNKMQLKSNTAKQGGAAFTEKGVLNINGVVFTQNSVTSNGGAVYTKGTVTNTTGENSFTSNSAAGHGGALYLNYVPKVAATETTAEVPAVNSDFNMTDGKFAYNTAMAGGAISARTGCKATLTNTALTGNSTEGYADKNDGDADNGGAIYVGFGEVTLNNVTATNNEAIATLYVNADAKEKLYSFGGVVDAYNATVNITGGTFTGNKAATGGVCYGKNSTVNITGAQFITNESTYVNSDYDSSCGGGAIATVNGTLNIDGATFDGNTTDYYGGAIHTSKTAVNVGNKTVVKNSTGKTGAAIYFSGSTITVSDTEISSNTSNNNGVVYIGGATSTLSKITASGNNGKYGGVVYLSGGNSTISASTFLNNTSTEQGGAIYQKIGTAIVDNCTFNTNSSKVGGAIYSVENAKLEVKNSTFTENSSTSNGGAVYASGSNNLTITQSEFTGNASTSNGGAAYIYNVPLTLTDSTFTSNISNSNGGAIYTQGVVTTATGNNTFTANSAKSHGGAVYVNYIKKVAATETTPEIPAINGDFNMTDGKFENNTAMGGGAISARTGCKATLTNTVLTGNSSEGYADKNDGDGDNGGAIYVGFGEVTLNNVTATNNEAKATLCEVENKDGTKSEKLYSFGGVVDAYNATVNITGGTFTGNKAATGGVCYGKDSTINITGAQFITNESTYVNSDYDSSCGGGAIATVNGTLNIDGATFDGNKTNWYGGSVLAAGTTVNISESAFENANGATGSALHFKNSCKVTVTDTNILNNKSNLNGVVYANGGTLTMERVTATGNTGNNGLIYASGGSTTVNLRDCDFNNNTAKTAGGVVASISAKINVENCRISQNTSKDGAVFYTENGEITITDSHLNNNTASASGGVLYAIGGRIIADNCQVIENKAASGGAFCGEGSDIEIRLCQFNNNSATNGGAVYTSENGHVALNDSSFESNTAKNNGGAVYTYHNAPVVVNNSVFTGNTAGNYGGAFNNAGSTVQVMGETSFTGNSAVAHGGVFYLTYVNAKQATETEPAVEGSVGVLEMMSGKLENNFAMVGGAISVRSNCEVTLNDTLITGNYSDGYDVTKDKNKIPDGDGDNGGVIYVGYGTATLNNVTATNNEAKSNLFEVENKDGTKSEKLYSFGGVVDAYNATVNITGGTFTGNKAATGGVCYGKDSTLNIVGGQFNANESTYENSDYDSSCGGGAVATVNGTLNIDGATFDGNTTDYYGGAIHTSKTAVNVGNKTVIKNSTGKTGAAIYFSGSTVTMNDVEVTTNTSGYNGVVFIGGATSTLSKITASGNNGKYGGVVYLSGGTSTVSNSTFSGNASTDSAGAIYQKIGTATVDSCTFSSNSSKVGGAIYSTENGKLEIKNSTFTQNTATSNGGALYAKDAGNITVTQCTFVKNSASGQGGAVYAMNSPCSIIGSEFTENTANSQGGAVWVNGTDEAFTVTGSTFTNNFAKSNGGAVYAYKVPFTLTDSTFTENSTNSHGGAICTTGVTTTATGNNIFTSNSAVNHGGAVYVTYSEKVAATETTPEIPRIGSEFNMTDGKFENNTAMGGGAISARTVCKATLTNTVLTGNSSEGYADKNDGDGDNGGAIYVGFGEVTLNNVTATNNEAKLSEYTPENSETTYKYSFGGVVDAYNATVNITGGTFTGNSAGAGGVVYANKSAVNLSGATFENNTVNLEGASTKKGGAIMLYGAAASVVDNCIFKTNTAATGGAMYVDYGATVTVTGGSFQGNQALAGDGGAILLADSTSSGKAATTLNITNASFTSNSASSKGGAISTDTSSPNLVLKATGCSFDQNSAVGAGAGAVEIQNGNQTSATDPTELKIVFTNCSFTNNTAKTTGGAIELRSGCAAKFDGITATGNKADGNGGVIYVTTGFSRVYITGSVTQSGNTTKQKGKFICLYHDGKYTTPPALYTTHSSTADWVSDVADARTDKANPRYFDLVTLP